MIAGRCLVLSFDKEIIETIVYYNGEDFYYIDKYGDEIEVREVSNKNYEYKI